MKEGTKGEQSLETHIWACLCLLVYVSVHECAHVLLAGIQLWPKLWSWGPGASPGTVAGVSPTTSWVPGMTSRSSSSPWEGQAVTPDGLSPIPLSLLPQPFHTSPSPKPKLCPHLLSGHLIDKGTPTRSRIPATDK